MLTTTQFEKKYGVKITKKHNGKMQELSSISTSPLDNPICQKRSNKPGSICQKCYSIQMNNMYKNFKNMLAFNTTVLMSQIIPDEDMPILYSDTMYFRFEAFGDIATPIQVVNYFNMAKYNPHLKCALWTKNPWIIQEAIDKYEIEKPNNLQIIGSSWKINEPMEKYYKKYDFIDNIFTVYDKKFISENGVDVNCGAKSCASCGKCYNGTHTEYNIREQLK